MAKTLPARVWSLPSILGTFHSDLQIETPAAVTNLQLTAVTTTAISLSWTYSLHAHSYILNMTGGSTNEWTLSSTFDTVANIAVLTPGTQYNFTVTPVNALGVEGNVSSTLQVTTTALPATDEWPVMDGGGLGVHAHPGINTFGSLSYGGGGRNPASSGVNIYLINSLATTTTVSAAPSGTYGSNVFFATLRGAMQHSAGTASKMIIPIVSGNVNINGQINITGDNISYYGQFAPHPGLFWRGSTSLIPGDHHQYWHVAAYHTDGTAANTQSNRDCFRVSTGASASSNVIFINSEFAWATDETIQVYYEGSDIGFVYCAFIEPVLRVWTEGVTGFGPMLGGQGGAADNIAIERSLIAHNKQRAPWLGARRTLLSNILWYNIAHAVGPSSGGVSVNYNNQFGHTSSMQHILVNSLRMRGPDNSTSNTMGDGGIQIQNGHTFPSSSGVYVEGLSQDGWTNPTTVNQFFNNLGSGGFNILGSVPSIMPTGRATDFSDTYEISATPLTASTAEKQDFVDLLRESVGMRPGTRTTAAGRVEAIFNQIQVRLDDDPDSPGQMKDPGTLANFTPAFTTVDPISPGSAWHAPMPTASTRHDVTAGTWPDEDWVPTAFRNQAHTGYTVMEAWAIAQHWYVGGK